MSVMIDTAPLRHPAFRRIWIGQGVSAIGFQLTAVVVPVQVYALTKSSLWVGTLGLANLIPLIFFGLWGGAIADHVDRRRLLLAASVISWCATLLLMAQALIQLVSVWVIMAMVIVQSSGFAISSPTRGAIIPRILEPAEVPAANTLNFTFSQVSILLGPLLAGVLLIVTDQDYALMYGMDALLFSAGLWAAFRLPPIPPLTVSTTRPGLRSVLEGFAFLATQPVLMMSFVVDIIAMAIAMPRALFPELATTRFGDPSAVGWLVAGIGLGGVVAGLLSGWVGKVRRQGLALILAVMFWGLAVAAAGLMHNLWAAVFLLGLGGCADLVSGVFRQTILQTYAPDEMRGRLQGVFIVVVAGGPRLGDLRAGAVAAATTASFSWVSGGIACAVLVLVAAALSPSLLNYRVSRNVGTEDER